MGLPAGPNSGRVSGSAPVPPAIGTGPHPADSAVGDGDLGASLDRGFAAVRTELAAAPPADLRAAFQNVATILIRVMGGTSGPGQFTFRAPTAIESLDPNHGPETGGTAVTISGTGFTDADGATFGGSAGGDFEVVNDTTV